MVETSNSLSLQRERTGAFAPPALFASTCSCSEGSTAERTHPSLTSPIPILCVQKDGDATKMPQEEDARREGGGLPGKGFSSMKRSCSRLCGSDHDEEEGASTTALTLGLSTEDVVLAFGATEKVH
ncbi:hypothetical protein B296_00046632 [Ensete ventricosum]|uniref:Uncharacterized protein n=1 Tax=Ensete ventricosum TaxID=4639 RepID=A0A426XTK4_ENSVE|nr:hypothetical protein B296_00046632 [Ensete ventricosum]